MALLSHMRALRALRALDYEVSFAAAGIIPCGAPYYSCVEDVLCRQARSFDLVYLHRGGNADKYLALARTHQPQARLVYSVADLHHLRLARQARVERSPVVAAPARLTAASELLAARRADIVITHSPVEAELLRREVGPAKVHVVPFAVAGRPVRRPFAQRRGIAFIGGREHAPNADAVHHLIDDVMPLVWRHDPALSCTIVGRGWRDDRLPRHDRRVVLAGAVHDLAAVFGAVRLTVAPLRFGAGIKGKVLDSLAAGLPCVMSPIAAEGLPLPAELQAPVGADAAALADRILRCHADGAANEAAGALGARLAAAEYAAARVVQALGEALSIQPRGEACALA